MERSSMKKQMRFMGTCVKGIFYSLIMLSMGACAGQQSQQGSGVNELAVIQVEAASTTLNSSYPATIEGRQDVEIRPQISGFITKVCVDEGDFVRKGQLLFLIDSVQYKAAADAAEAAVKVAEANVATAKLTVRTKTELADKNIISQYDLQTAQNTLASAEANLAQAKAQLVNARNNLSYTRIVSPSNGIVNTIPYRIGSLVSASIVTPLTTVSDISNMYVYFSMTEKQLLNFTREGGTMAQLINSFPEVELMLVDGTMYKEKGKVETISGAIDKTTGSVRMRATFPNDKNILRSGGSGNVLIPVKMDGVLSIPQKATYELQDKRFVYVVTDSSVLQNREIQVLPQNDGKNFFVTSGLQAGERIVYEGVGTLRNGMRIKAITPAEAESKYKSMVKNNSGVQNN